MQLPDVVHDTEQLPLSVDLVFSSEREAVQSKARGDVAEHRLHRAQPSSVDMSSLWAVDLALHAVDGPLRSRFGPAAVEKMDLPWAFLIRSL